MMRVAGSDSPTGTVPLFTPILPPMIESVSHEALELSTQWCSQCEIISIIAYSYYVFCELKLNIEPPAATDGMLIAETEPIVSSIKNDKLPDIKELFTKELLMNMKESDVNARLTDYFKTFSTRAG
ncbi:hypothetical protein PC116_g18424 [Phytophthora cactorum]|uniref:Uncharacterized protein n=1 Tax=Phytophthora cactorum TaxID=29920 RepID=A0A8T1K897_9STRA|nr:hypothetical protein PC112_g8702 [Phytophthora cactorum]KAG2850479.1 hypothetical protein PC113_g16741 [Phytophthora cactorum]KAG2913561.1 hypothetical protein PC117_g18539 [Phytophthora cactorum]KAG2973988.1 hypothetical protein PC119_g22770 [Phytophthora cactorum]KAG3130650.1 hypothetical protein C6341_g23663 [Phytophthora cactorum]